MKKSLASIGYRFDSDELDSWQAETYFFIDQEFKRLANERDARAAKKNARK